MARPDPIRSPYADTDDAPGGGEAPDLGGWQMAQSIPVPIVDRSSKPDHSLDDVMHTPSMSSPAATRPRKGSQEVLDGNSDDPRMH